MVKDEERERRANEEKRNGGENTNKEMLVELVRGTEGGEVGNGEEKRENMVGCGKGRGKEREADTSDPSMQGETGEATCSR